MRKGDDLTTLMVPSVEKIQEAFRIRYTFTLTLLLTRTDIVIYPNIDHSSPVVLRMIHHIPSTENL